MGSAAQISTLVAADEVQGAIVYNRTTGDRLGSIDSLIIDRKTGNVAYAIMSSGGFLGMGGRHHPLPWTMLKYDTNMGGYVVPLERAQLEGVPAYGRWL